MRVLDTEGRTHVVSATPYALEPGIHPTLCGSLTTRADGPGVRVTNTGHIIGKTERDNCNYCERCVRSYNGGAR